MRPQMRVMLLMTCLGIFVGPAVAWQDKKSDAASKKSDSNDAELARKGLDLLRQIEAAQRMAIKKVESSVVSIFIYSTEPTFENLPFRSRRFSADPVPASYGTGIVVRESGLILTAYHVVNPMARDSKQYRMEVMTVDGQVYNASLIAGDARSDLAVVKLVADTPIKLKPIEFGRGDVLRRGDMVIAIGNTFGARKTDGLQSASAGIVSNIGRRSVVATANEDSLFIREPLLPLHSYGGLIQTDCRLNMGISGGALIDLDGKLVGLIMALAAANGTETPGGFAFPIDDFSTRIIDCYCDGKEFEFGMIGVRNPDQVTVNLPGVKEPTFGVELPTLDPNSPAARSRVIRPGDIVISLNGKRTEHPDELVLEVNRQRAGDVIPAEILRDRELLNVKVPLTKFPVRWDNFHTVKRPAWNGVRVDFLNAANEFSDIGGGVSIREIVPNSLADQKGLRINIVVSAVNDKRVDSPDEFDKAVAEAKYPVKLTLPGHSPPEVVFESDAPPAKKAK